MAGSNLFDDTCNSVLLPSRDSHTAYSSTSQPTKSLHLLSDLQCVLNLHLFVRVIFGFSA